MASRLSEIQHFKVLLVEDGINEGILTDIPLVSPAATYPIYGWNYTVEPQKYAFGGK